MHWMERFYRYPWPLYLFGGLFLGVFVGYKILPQVLPEQAPPITTTETASQLQARQQLEAQLAAGLVLFDFVEQAHVQLAPSQAGARRPTITAAVTLSLGETQPTDSQLVTMAEQVAASVTGLSAGSVTIVDASGRALNLEQLVAHERKVFWTGIAINVAKVLGILAALITLRFIIETIGKRVNGEDTSCC